MEGLKLSEPWNYPPLLLSHNRAAACEPLTKTRKKLVHQPDCVLGPSVDDSEKQSDLRCITPTRIASGLPLSHQNAFHVWDQDDVVIPLTPEESPQGSPLMLAGVPYIPAFFPRHGVIESPTHASSLPREIAGP